MKQKSIILGINILIISFFILIHNEVVAEGVEKTDGIGPQSVQAIGEKNVLIVVVQFPDASPSTPVELVQKRVVGGLNSYVKEQSFGLASIKADFMGYIMLPDSLTDYKISPYNFRVDKTRIRKKYKSWNYTGRY